MFSTVTCFLIVSKMAEAIYTAAVYVNNYLHGGRVNKKLFARQRGRVNKKLFARQKEITCTAVNIHGCDDIN